MLDHGGAGEVALGVSLAGVGSEAQTGRGVNVGLGVVVEGMAAEDRVTGDEAEVAEWAEPQAVKAITNASRHPAALAMPIRVRHLDQVRRAPGP